jgi:hypothetical protein
VYAFTFPNLNGPKPPGPPGSRSILADIARDAGVSTATVSRVINNRGPVASPTRDAVRRAIEAHHYSPNAHARGLALGRSSLIGLIVSDIFNPFFPDPVKEMESVAFEHVFDLILANTNHDPERRSIIPIASASRCQCRRRSSSANRQRPRRRRARRHCGATSTRDHRATALPVPCLIVTTRSAGPPLNRSFVPPGHVISIAS